VPPPPPTQYHFGGLGGLAEDKAKGVELWGRAAEKGDTESLYILGLCHAQGQGLERPDEDAARKCAPPPTPAAPQRHTTDGRTRSR
jgi:hypothetical protein